MSGIVNKIKEKLHSDHSDSTTTTGHSSTTTGHHTATGSGAPTGTGTRGSVHGTTGVGGISPHNVTGATHTAGPHDSNVANRADPVRISFQFEIVPMNPSREIMQC